MDQGSFDGLTRYVASGSATRRATFSLLTGAALGLLTARFGVDGDARAKSRRASRAESRQKEPLAAEGKRRGKKGKNKPKPKPPCGAGKWRCADGSCVPQDQCCPGEKRCLDGSCRSEDQCCNDQKRCSDGSCVASNQCCFDEWPCSDGSCVTSDLCCPDEKRCEDDSCIALDQCCDDALPQLCVGECQEEVCEDGEWVCRPMNRECPPGKGFDERTCLCECPDEYCPSPRERDSETCACECATEGTFCYMGYAHLDYCCPASHPVCWWAGGTRIGCVTDDQGDHVCPIGWSIMPGSDPEHRHCFPPPGATARQAEDRSAEHRQPEARSSRRANKRSRR